MKKHIVCLVVFSGFLVCAQVARAGNENANLALQKRFAAFSDKVKKKTEAEKRLYAACLAHAGQAPMSFSFIKREISPRAEDVALYSRYYRLAVICKEDDAPQMLRNLIGTVVTKPFESIAECDRARILAKNHRSVGIDLFKKAIQYDPLNPEPYFELAKMSSAADEQYRYCASALLLCDNGSEMALRVIDFLEKAK
jgi:hypothetical protein